MNLQRFLKIACITLALVILALGSVLIVRVFGKPVPARQDEPLSPLAPVESVSPQSSSQSLAPRSPYPTLGPGGERAGESRSSGATSTPGAVSFPNCAAMWAVDPNGVFRGEPGYSLRLDRDRDDHACDTDGSDNLGAPTTEPATGISPSPRPSVSPSRLSPKPPTVAPTTTPPPPVISIPIIIDP